MKQTDSKDRGQNKEQFRIRTLRRDDLDEKLYRRFSRTPRISKPPMPEPSAIPAREARTLRELSPQHWRLFRA
ncbi:MAG: hypothetical protein NTY53_14500 [Kiritimatiellaeota bacterium]|nr:hypothetical protein [Kiritimatiellota bacterium]